MQLTNRLRVTRIWSSSLTTVWVLALAIAVHALPAPLIASDVKNLPKPFLEKIALARHACAEINRGEFALELRALERVDLDGDLISDWVLNEGGFACSSAASLYHGTGGSMSHFLVSDQLASLLNQGWDAIDLGQNRVLLANVHGSQCGGINPTPCVTASIWDSEEARWRSASAEWQ